MRICLHPDDPPLPEVRGVPRIMGTPAAFDRVLATVPSAYSGITVCQGNHETGFDGPMRPDHVPALAGESNESYGYATLGRLFAVGYITGLRDATYGRPPARYGRHVGEDALR